jgi:heterogeneous nuclear ribonucleoprotein F/H
MENMNNMDNPDIDNMEMRHFIKLRGLPWNSTAEDIMEFLENIEVVGGEKGIHMSISPRDGRPNGEAFVELANADDVDMAFGYNKKSLGHRYIEGESSHTK